MSRTAAESQSVVVERELAFPPEKIWRALTQPHLLQEWLMKTDFEPKLAHPFKFTGDWGSVDCKVMVVEPKKALAYTWGAFGLETMVTWTITPTSTGTHLRVEQAGFGPEQKQAFHGARAGWPRFLNALEATLGRLD